MQRSSGSLAEVVTEGRPALGEGRTGLVTWVREGFDELPSLRDRWEALFCARPNEPSLSFEWTTAMARHHAKAGDRPFLVGVERDGTLAGVVPLILRTHRLMGQRIRLLAPLSEPYNTHSDLLLASHDEDVVSALVAAIGNIDAEWDCFRMARLLEENPVGSALRRAIDAAGYLHDAREGLPAYVLDLPASYEAYLGSRSAKFRNFMRRAERKLAAAGVVGVHELSDEGRFDEAFGALLRIERASWKQQHGTSIAAVERQSGFYRDLARAALERGRLHLQWLTLDGRPLAYNLGYVAWGGYHYLKTSYDDEFRPLSPATYLRGRLINGLIERGIGRLDFPGEPYEWEAQWTDGVRWRTVLSAYPRTARGRMLAAVDRLRHRNHGNRRIRHVDPRAIRAPGGESA